MDPETFANNLRDAFTVLPTQVSQIQNQNVLLLDDVYITGATTHECTKILRANGVHNIVILTITSVT